MNFNDKLHFGAICRDAIDTFGAEHQLIKTLEELSELQKEICKYFECEESWQKELAKINIAEETADVEIMLEQLKIIFKNADAVDQWRGAKLERLERRLHG